MSLITNSSSSYCGLTNINPYESLYCPVDHVRVVQEKHPGKVVGELLRALYDKVSTVVSEMLWGIDDKEKILSDAPSFVPKVMECASTRLQDDDEVVLKLLSQSWDSLYYASSRLRNDKKIALEYMKLTDDRPGFVGWDLQNNKNFWLEAYQNNPREYKWLFASHETKYIFRSIYYHIRLGLASPEVRSNKTIVLFAVEQNGRNL